MPALFIAGLLVGSMAGGALGLLLAPERGEQTRRRLRSSAGPAVEKLKVKANELAKRERAPTEGMELEE